MQCIQYFIVFLLSSFSIQGMELAISDKSSGIQGVDDAVLTASICPRLGWQARNALRCTCKKYLKLVHSKDELNKKYKKACDEKNVLQMTYWKNLGGCYFYQEFANAVKNKKDKFAEWLIEKNKVIIEDVLLNNISESVTTLTVDEITPVIQWLLNSIQSICPKNNFFFSYNSYYLICNATKILAYKYPEAQIFIVMFEKYKEEQEDFEIAIGLTTGLAW
jgi:hypothetical protein